MGTQTNEVPFKQSQGLSPALAGRFKMSTPLTQHQRQKFMKALLHEAMFPATCNR